TPRIPRIAFVMGDPAGISAELAAKLLADKSNHAYASVLVIGDRRVLAAGERIAGVNAGVTVVTTPRLGEPGAPLFYDLKNCDPKDVTPGQATKAGGASVMANFRLGLELARDGAADVVFFTPFNKQALRLAGNPYLDEIHFAADVLGHNGDCSEFNILGNIWNARVTSHIPFKDVLQFITIDNLLKALALTDGTMRAAGFANPRIALAALNPHAGDGGTFGTEEIEILAPAIARAKAQGIAADGPFPADTVFLRARAGQFDAVLTLFHDQGQIAIKALGFDQGVTVLGGMPVPLCTPAHGTAYEIAGKGIANVEASKRAFAIACSMGSRRLLV
ncbi:MAG: 4-hydroxythreonine-4-phosphate dehydrogenase PdxA, partial [Pseudolabrys sp.]